MLTSLHMSPEITPSGLQYTQYDERALREIDQVSRSVALERSQRQSAREKLVSKKIVRRPTADNHVDVFWKDVSVLEPAEQRSPGGKENNMPAEWADLMAATEQLHVEEDEMNAYDTGNQLPHTGRTGKVVNCLITGQEQEEVRKQEVKQRAMLRRLYMDIEREQVKEYRKLKKHLDRIAELKKGKEEERRRVEMEAMVNSLPRMGPEPDRAEFLEERRRLEEEQSMRRETETKRYIKALRTLLREKLDRLGITVPPLCSCGDTVWDSHPDRCANNCPFYRNPKGYERALQTLLKSCDSML